MIRAALKSLPRFPWISAVLGGLAFLSVSLASAADSTPSEGVGDLSGATEDGAYCAAVTTCFSPYRPPYSIGCQTYGQGCTWWVVANHSVQCTGFDAWGRWVHFYFRCW